MAAGKPPTMWLPRDERPLVLTLVFPPAVAEDGASGFAKSKRRFAPSTGFMTLDQVRQFALSLLETTEEPHFHYTSFRVRGKIFATAPPGGEDLHVFVTDEQRETALASEPDFLDALRWGGQVRGVRVLLPGAKPEVVFTLLTQAWSRRAPKRLLALAHQASPS